jgi:hypothetical protein
MPEGANLTPPPHFAVGLNDFLSRNYLKYIKMGYNYRFNSNRPGVPDVAFDVKLKDESGKEIAVCHFPDPDANYWVRHRQSLLARALVDDQPVQPPQSELIAAPNQQAPSAPIWSETGERGKLNLKIVPLHLIPRERTVFRPSDWSILLARSYSRYLCRVYGAASAEVIRRTKDPIPPGVLFLDEPPPGPSEELNSNFGELPR